MSLQTTSSGYFRPVGTNSFGGSAAFDQQPVEATATISAFLAASRAEDGNEWAARALHAFGWFLGENDLKKALIFHLSAPLKASHRSGLRPLRTCLPQE
jgi:hypothetical protein